VPFAAKDQGAPGRLLLVGFPVLHDAPKELPRRVQAVPGGLQGFLLLDGATRVFGALAKGGPGKRAAHLPVPVVVGDDAQDGQFGDGPLGGVKLRAAAGLVSGLQFVGHGGQGVFGGQGYDGRVGHGALLCGGRPPRESNPGMPRLEAR